MPLLNKKNRRKNAPTLRASGPSGMIRGTILMDLGAASITAASATNPVPSFTMAAYNGGPMMVSGWNEPIVVDCAGIEAIDRPRPILLEHDFSKRVGHATDFSSENRLAASGLISASNRHAREVVNSSKNGFPWQTSIGAKVLESTRLAKGKTMIVNGRTIAGPAIVATRVRLNEVSFVTLGADESTSASITATMRRKDNNMKTFDEWLAAMGLTASKLDDVARTKLNAKWKKEMNVIKASAKAKRAKALAAATAGGSGDDDEDAEADEDEDDDDIAASGDNDEDEDDDEADADDKDGNKKPITAASKDDDEDEDDEDEEDAADVRAAAVANRRVTREVAVTSVRQEHSRIDAIKRICKGKFDKIEARAIANGWNTKRTELAVFKAGTPRTVPGISFGGRPATAVLEAAVIASAGIYDDKKLTETYGERTLDAAHKQFKGRIGLRELLIEGATMSGFSGRQNFTDTTTLRDILATGFSNTNFSGILSNVANKVLLAGFTDSEQLWRLIFKVSTVSDFKLRTSYRMQVSGRFQVVGADGEIKHAQLGDKTYGIQADTYGLMVAITRKQIIDDDMGALTDVPRQLGFNAGQTINAAAWGLFLASQSTFYTSGNKNLLASAPTLGIEGYLKLEALLRAQTTDSGDPIGSAGRPKLVVPPALSGVARQLMASQTTNFNTTTQTGVSNPVFNRADVVDSDWIGANMKGGSDNDYFLARSSNIVPPYEIAFLDGVQTPKVEQSEADFAQLGIQMRGYFDFGTAVVDPRGAVKADVSPTGPDTAL